MDDHNHALAALRYLVSRLDARRMAGGRDGAGTNDPSRPARKPRPWLRLDNEAIWTQL